MALSTPRRAWLRYGLSVADVLMVATPPQADLFRASGLVPSRPNETWDVVRDKITERVIKDCGQYYDGLEKFEIARRPLRKVSPRPCVSSIVG